MKYLLVEREPDNSSKSNQTRAKGSPPEKNTTSMKSYSLYLQVTLQKVVDGVGEGENQSSQSHVCVTAFWGTEG